MKPLTMTEEQEREIRADNAECNASPHGVDCLLIELDALRARLAAAEAERPSEGERKLLDRVREARRGKLAGAVAADLECCATDTPCIDGCPYYVDQTLLHADDCAQEDTAHVLLALAALLAPESEAGR